MTKTSEIFDNKLKKAFDMTQEPKSACCGAELKLKLAPSGYEYEGTVCAKCGEEPFQDPPQEPKSMSYDLAAPTDATHMVVPKDTGDWEKNKNQLDKESYALGRYDGIEAGRAALLKELEEKLLRMSQEPREGTTYGDTIFPDDAVVYGYNEALSDVSTLLHSKHK